jgi:hypothetical protein
MRPPQTEAGLALSVMRRYVELVGSGQYQDLKSLFAADASLTMPSGIILQGRDAISDWLVRTLTASHPKPIIVSAVDGGEDCAVEMQVHTASSTRPKAIADCARVDGDGRIVRLSIYQRA